VGALMIIVAVTIIYYFTSPVLAQFFSALEGAFKTQPLTTPQQYNTYAAFLGDLFRIFGYSMAVLLMGAGAYLILWSHREEPDTMVE